jgi:RHS repeat-associated protein
MEKKSGVGENSHARFGGGLRSIGDTFQPNLAMGGGSYRVPIELPAGPGGFTPKLDLVYDTGYGNGPFGLGWTLTLPFVERRRKSPFVPAGESEYTLGGGELLVPAGDGAFVPFIDQALQRYAFDGVQWTGRAPDLVEMRFGATAASRVAGLVDGAPRVQRWLLDRITYPGERTVEIDYEEHGGQAYPRAVRWSVFRLDLLYEDRPDPWSRFDAGFEIRTARRCRRLEVHQSRLAPQTLMRTFDLGYEEAEHTRSSLLRRIAVSGWRVEDGAWRETALPPLVFGYTRFSPRARDIVKLRSETIPPPPLGEDVTLLDYRGTGLPGVLRLNGVDATYWENRGNLQWGPPERLRNVPAGIALSDPGVRFADMAGRGTADLVVGEAQGGGYYPHDPERGFQPKRDVALAPSFGLGDEDSYLIDLDGDRVADLLTFRNGTPMAFFNEGGRSWSGPVSLPVSGLPPLALARKRIRFADMNGDGQSDLVLLRSRRVSYWPYLGNGRWGEERVMAGTPEFDVPRPDDDVYLADVDGDGAADLLLVGNGVVRLYLNRGGDSFAEPIVLERTPRLGVEQFLLADMTGSGTLGLLFTIDSDRTRPHAYWFLDLLDGVKPYLLQTIDNSAGLVTTIEYTTSAFERAADLADGVRWSGYLPFTVPVVRRVTLEDAVTGQRSVNTFRYHDGHFDGRSREYLGFARVESLRTTGPEEEPLAQRYFFHNRATAGDDPGFLAGKGQPRRTELIDQASGEIRQIEESVWEARQVAGTTPDRPAWLAVQSLRASRRLEAGEVYEREEIETQVDALGSVTRERRSGFWTDSDGNPRADELILETSYAEHPVHGLTRFASRKTKRDGAGRLLKDFRFHYDGAPFLGLPLGAVEKGFKTRQTEVALTAAEIAEAYGGVPPPLLASLYRTEADPDLGTVWVRDVSRVRCDAFGNEVEVLDALGLRTAFAFDDESIHPVSVSEDGGPQRRFAFDRVAQQIRLLEDLNGNLVETRYDGLGNIVAVWSRDAHPDRPTETYEHRHGAVPCSVVQRVRVHPGDAEPGAVKIDYYDGCGRICQTRVLAEDGRWAVGKQQILSIHDRLIGERDAWFSAVETYEPAPPPGVAARQVKRDFASRVVEETLFNGRATRHVYKGNEIRFYAPDAADALALDPATPPSRVSRTSASGLVVSIVERDAAGTYEQRRDYDPLRRMVRIRDPLGHTVLENAFDLWGNKIRIRSAEAGITTFVFDAASNEVQRTDADGRVLFQARDGRGRLRELRTGGPVGPVEEVYVYDAGPGANLMGRLARVTGGWGTAEYSYSAEGDAVEIRRTLDGNPETFVTGFDYNGQRQPVQVRYPDGSSVSYEYHATGLLAAIPGYIDALEYGPTGKRQRLVYANGLETRRGYTPGDYLIAELLTQPVAGGAKYQHLIYHLDGTGQVVEVEDLSTVPGKVRLNQSFTYDERHRLTHAAGSFAGYDFAYRYDELGNLVFSGESFAEEMDYGRQTGDAAHPNRLVKRHAAAAAEYAYDAAGNLTRDPALGNLFYDARHRLVRVERPDGGVVEYSYDHNDRRVKSVVTHSGAVEIRYEVEGIYLVEAGGASRIVFDEDRRLAVVPAAGDALLQHLDRLGNVNVISNLGTGAFVGHDEYTPYGRLLVSIALQPAFSFQGGRFSDGLDVVLLGARYYRPTLGRFLTSDPYLIVNQDKIPPLLAAANLYLYAYCNPTNFTDPTGEIAPLLVALIIAAIVGAIIGAAGAAANGAKTWDEWLVWIVGGMIGAVLTVLGFYGLGFLAGGAAVGLAAAKVALVVWTVASVLGVLLTPILDQSDSPVAWVFSWIIKVIKSPVLSIIGLFVVAGLAIAGKKVDFRRGALFVEVGSGTAALTLGAIVYSEGGNFDAMGRVRDDVARHEAYHTRTVAALGEVGFYITYLTVGGLIGLAQAGGEGYLGLNSSGCGNPFEKTAYTYYSPFLGGPGMGTTSASSC